MGKINMGRVILGGIVAGIVANLFEDGLNGYVLADQWRSLMNSINRPALDMTAVGEFNFMGFVLGIAAVWTYAAIRPRFGAGPRTAFKAALLVWVLGYLVADATPAIMGVFPFTLACLLLIVGLVEIVVATFAGAWFYKEA
ncbi:MAG: hypothetical protein ACREHE_12525 [Rhizomicrobium sp.]